MIDNKTKKVNLLFFSAVVGSGDSSCSTTAVRVCKQYPKEGKCSIEMIIGMQEMVEQLLNYNRKMNQYLPTKIIFYRDGKFCSFFLLKIFLRNYLGVDDGQFRKIFDNEIPAIRQAFNSKLFEKKEDFNK